MPPSSSEKEMDNAINDSHYEYRCFFFLHKNCLNIHFEQNIDNCNKCVKPNKTNISNN